MWTLLWDFIQTNAASLLGKTAEHLGIALIALLLGTLAAVPLGIALTFNKKLSRFTIGFASLLQTVPSLALLAMMIPIFGIGKLPAVIALFLYSLLPILRNTFLGIDGVSPELIDAAKGMGMTPRQILTKVKLPLAVPVIMSGIRLSAVYVIAWTTLASYIGAGGLGDFIFSGLTTYNPPMILAGAIPVSILALVLDYLLGHVESTVSPKTCSVRK